MPIPIYVELEIPEQEEAEEEAPKENVAIIKFSPDAELPKNEFSI